jgi:hypothetical protein
MWVKWVASLTVGAILLVALILFVEHNNGNGEAAQNPGAVARANRESEILVAADQAPHVYRIEGRQSSRGAIAKGVRIEMTELINRGTIAGTLASIRCGRDGGTSTRQAFRCTAVVAGVNYPFLGVVDRRGTRLTLCKRDEPPLPSMNIPVSPRCLP